MPRRPTTPSAQFSSPAGDGSGPAGNANWFVKHKRFVIAFVVVFVGLLTIAIVQGPAKTSTTSANGSTTSTSNGAAPTTLGTAAAPTPGSETPTAHPIGAPAPSTETAATSATSPLTTPSTTTSVTAPPSKTLVASSAAAIAALNTLAIKGRAPMTGYSRAQFGPAWPDLSGCDERNDTLQRDLTAIAMRDTCIVASGTLVSPYTGGTISFVRGPNSAAVQIDHVVALGDAWQTGAQYWNATTREAFANDPIELLAVDAYSNEQKGDSDAASWLPANKAFRCTYVSMQVDVKAKYRLWVTQAEHDAIGNILAGCAGRSVQTSTASTPTRSDVATPVAPAPTTRAAPAPTTPAAPAPTHSYVTPGAFCSTAGATGVSKTGKPEVCKTTATDSRLRWRAA